MMESFACKTMDFYALIELIIFKWFSTDRLNEMGLNLLNLFEFNRFNKVILKIYIKLDCVVKMMKTFGLLFLISSCWIMHSSYRPHLSDAWYPARAKILRHKVQDLQNQAAIQYGCHLNPSDIVALLVPHAGYDYSGVIAASVYQNIRPGIFKRVIILGPSHHGSFQGVALPGVEYDSFKNSLGKISLDVAVLKSLHKDKSGLFQRRQRAHDVEHCIEVQIPFIQTYCGSECTIVPLLVGLVGEHDLQTIAKALQPFLDESTLVIATSDLTHYGSSFGYVPFTSDIGRQIVALDNELVEKIQNFDGLGLASVKRATGATVCGVQSITVLLALLQEKRDVVDTYVTGYDRSSGQEENPEHSVSYVGMIFSKQKRSSLSLSDQLTGYEKNILRDLVQSALLSLDSIQECRPSGILTKPLRTHQGAFVTLYDTDHALRGCIGKVTSDQPLYQTVCEMAYEAALHDPRFKSVESSELKDITSTISVLTLPQKILSYHDIRLGIDGVVLKYAMKSAVFLPKVALEFGWDRRMLLQQLSMKAGLESDAFEQPGATFEVFQAIDF